MTLQANRFNLKFHIVGTNRMVFSHGDIGLRNTDRHCSISGAALQRQRLFNFIAKSYGARHYLVTAMVRSFGERFDKSAKLMQLTHRF